jgi:hypothetical protein
MAVTGEEGRDAGQPNINRMREMLAEARAAARAIYESYPDPSRAEGAYAQLQKTLDALGDALDRLEDRTP